MATIYHAGGEDTEFFQVGGGAVTNAGGRFRGTARCALASFGTNPQTVWWQNDTSFSASTFWLGAWLYTSDANSSNNATLMRFFDASGIVRLRFRTANGSSFYVVEKVDAAGTATQLGTINQWIFLNSGLSKFDVHLVNAVAGLLEVYINTKLAFSFSGDTTTNSVTLITDYQLGGSAANVGLGGNCWSEVVVTDVDTRSLTLQTFGPVANGNTHNFDIGTPAAANVNEVFLNTATLDGATTAGLIDQYTQGAVTGGTFAVLAVGVSAYMQRGFAGPTKADLGVRTGGADFWSADKTLTSPWNGYQNWWSVNPNTSLSWQTTEIGSTAGFNIGIKAVA